MPAILPVIYQDAAMPFFSSLFSLRSWRHRGSIIFSFAFRRQCPAYPPLAVAKVESRRSGSILPGSRRIFANAVALLGVPANFLRFSARKIRHSAALLVLPAAYLGGNFRHYCH